MQKITESQYDKVFNWINRAILQSGGTEDRRGLIKGQKASRFFLSGKNRDYRIKVSKYDPNSSMISITSAFEGNTTGKNEYNYNNSIQKITSYGINQYIKQLFTL